MTTQFEDVVREAVREYVRYTASRGNELAARAVASDRLVTKLEAALRGTKEGRT